MRFRAFSVYDQKAKAFLPPFFLPEQGQAVRSFSDAVNSDGHQFAKHPEDYSLYEIGDFDDSTGELTSIKASIICHASGVKHVQKESNPADLLSDYPEAGKVLSPAEKEAALKERFGYTER